MADMPKLAAAGQVKKENLVFGLNSFEVTFIFSAADS
jgi:hypothetical protein